MPGFNYGGGVGDGTGWSSERGHDTDPGADNGHGHGGDRDNSSSRGKSSGGGSSNIEHTPWGDITTDASGYSYMNGIKLTAENSQLAYASPTKVTRVLNSLLDRSFMKPEPGEHSGVTGVSATTPSRLTLASNALIAAQSAAKTAADNLSKANANVNQAQIRLNNARAKIPNLQADIISKQKIADKGLARTKELGYLLNGDEMQRRPALQASYYYGLSLKDLNNAKKALVNAQSEITAAQKSLDDAKKALPVAAVNKQNADSAVASVADMKDAITTATAFLESISKKFGERAARLAQELAAQARSAKVRSVPEAIALFDKHKGTALNRLNAADKAAIANAFKSFDQAAIAKQLAAYSKVFGRFNKVMDLADIGAAVKKGIETGDWKDAINKLESIALTNTTGQLVAIAFAAAGSPLGIVGFGVTLTLAGVLFSNEKVLSAINTSLGM